MNGWQRLGVIASVVWFIGGWIIADNAQEKQYREDWRSRYRICSDLIHDPAKAVEQSDHAWRKQRNTPM